MKPRLAYVTDDVNNLEKSKRFFFLKNDFDIKLVTSNQNYRVLYGEDVEFLVVKSNTIDRLKNKLLHFSSLCGSKFSKLYFFRNYHVRYRLLINIIHLLKLFLSYFRVLPSYSKVLELCYKHDARFDKVIDVYDYIIFDSLLINNENFHSFLTRSSYNENVKLIADVYSWDNVHYSSLVYFADYYLLWNPDLKNKLLKNHPLLKNKKFLYTGVQYMNYLVDLVPDESNENNYILYAAVYPDEITAKEEVKIVIRIADLLLHKFPDVKLYFRPYPSVNKRLYASVLSHPQIIFKEFGKLQKRFQHAEEVIRVDTNLQDKLNLIANSTCFISLGSTFTFEAAFLGKPIIQLNLSDREYKVINRRYKTADHIQATFITENNENVVSDFHELEKVINNIIFKKCCYSHYSMLLKNYISLESDGNFKKFSNAIQDVLDYEL